MIALTAGDPSGIGIEIALKAWRRLGGNVPYFLIGDVGHVADVAKSLNLPFEEIESPEDAMPSQGLPVYHHAFPEPAKPGVAQPGNAASVVSAIKQAVDFAQKGKVEAICTNPINKKILQEGAYFPFPGHTEFLAHLGSVDTSVMMLTAPELSVVPVTIHIALKDVAAAVTAELLEETIRITYAAHQRDFALQKPRLALAGLNPHAGESGVMGDEEERMIIPLITRLRAQGYDISGPHSADTMFHRAARKNYDVAICMYHDQALIPIKTLNFSGGVNTTLGLPFIRTSPDHGTAFDIAGRGVADETSLVEALKLAEEMARNRKVYDARD